MAIRDTHLWNVKDDENKYGRPVVQTPYSTQNRNVKPGLPGLPSLSGLNNNTPNNNYNYYSSVAMPNWQTYTPSSFSGWQTYQDNPYQGYKDFTYDPFQYEDFSYDYRTDPLYQMYEESYTRGGNQAMQDTLTALSNRTGGIANSYSQAAAQNEYNTYMADLAAKIPELQQIARKMYDTDRNFAFDNYRDERDFAYNNYLRGYNEDYANWQNSNAIAQANVDLNNQYNYANWQMQEAARQAAVEMANNASMQKWKYDQDAANNNASYNAKLKELASGYEDQIASMQNYTDDSVEGIIADYLLSSHDRGDEYEAIRQILADAVGPTQDGTQGVGGFTKDDADALLRRIAQNPMEYARNYVAGRNAIQSQLKGKDTKKTK